jgi:hypothetical protein
MSISEAELRGRAVAQHFYTELEKIAYSKATQALYRQAKGAQDAVDISAKARGLGRFIPTTEAWREHRALKATARDTANAAEAKARRDLKLMTRGLAAGRGNAENIKARIDAGPQNIKPSRAALRSVGINSKAETPEFRKKEEAAAGGKGRKLLAGAGLVGAGAGGLYLGQQYLGGGNSSPY